MGDNNTSENTGKFPWKATCSGVPQEEVEKRMGVSMIGLDSKVIAPRKTLVSAGYRLDRVGSDADAIQATKDEVYKSIVR